MIVVTAVIFLLGIIRIYNKWNKKKFESNESMVGKVVIVTGANRGLGFQAAKALAVREARVILACRDEDKGRAARDAIISETRNPNVVFRRLDLCSLSSVREFCKETLEKEQRLDVLINNAGVYGMTDRLTEDGILENMQINHFGPFLLTLLLIPLLLKSKPARIVNISSILHYFGEVKVNQLNSAHCYSSCEPYKHLRYYANSKLCNILFTVELARRLKDTGVVAHAVHPGVIMTDIGKESELTTKIFWGIWCWLCCTTAEEGIQTIVYSAVAEECANISGEYFVDCKKARTLGEAKNPKTAMALWDLSENLVRQKFVFPEDAGK